MICRVFIVGLFAQRDFGHDPDEDNQDRRDEQNAKNGPRHTSQF
jgi:hypothetical protein